MSSIASSRTMPAIASVGGMKKTGRCWRLPSGTDAPSGRKMPTSLVPALQSGPRAASRFFSKRKAKCLAHEAKKNDAKALGLGVRPETLPAPEPQPSSGGAQQGGGNKGRFI